MAKAIAAWEGGIHNRIELALRSDGKLFRRFQEKGRYGYQWSRWAEDANHHATKDSWTIEQGFSTCHRASTYSKWQKWRLPN